MNEADNDLVGSVDGQRRLYPGGAGERGMEIPPTSRVVIGAFFDEQSLDGDTVSSATFEDGVTGHQRRGMARQHHPPGRY